jgi:hypothetical protein
MLKKEWWLRSMKTAKLHAETQPVRFMYYLMQLFIHIVASTAVSFLDSRVKYDEDNRTRLLACL